MPERIAAITGKTMVPISLIVGMLGGSGWLTKMHSTIDSNKQVIERLDKQFEKHIDKVESHLINIEKRLSRIEGKLNK